MDKKSIGQKILYFPLTKIIIGLIVCGVIVSVGQLLVGKLLNLTELDKDIKNLINGIVVAILALVSYVTLYKFYEKREIKELSKNGLFKSLTIGIILGVLLQSLTILVIYLKGGYSIVSINPILFLVPPFAMAFTSAIFEEILMRGIVFRITEDKYRRYALHKSIALCKT